MIIDKVENINLIRRKREVERKLKFMKLKPASKIEAFVAGKRKKPASTKVSQHS